MYELIKKLFVLASRFEQGLDVDPFWMDVTLGRIYDRDFRVGEWCNAQLPSYTCKGIEF